MVGLGFRCVLEKFHLKSTPNFGCVLDINPGDSSQPPRVGCHDLRDFGHISSDRLDPQQTHGKMQVLNPPNMGCNHYNP